jgi:hypothetical protein
VRFCRAGFQETAASASSITRRSTSNCFRQLALERVGGITDDQLSFHALFQHFNNTSAKLSFQAFWFPVCLICRLVGPFSPEIARYVLEELLCKKIEGCD